MPGRIDQEYRYTAGQNNGRVSQMKDWISGEEVTYTYDSLNRLIQAVTTGSEYGVTFSYDGFGNMTSQHAFKGIAFDTNLGYNGLTNRITSAGYGYDANGNMTAMPYLTMTYDAQNRLVESTHSTQGTPQYGYAPGGQRVWMRNPPADPALDDSSSIKFYGPDGNLYQRWDPKLAQWSTFRGSCSTEPLYYIGRYVHTQPAPYFSSEFGQIIMSSYGTAVISDRLGSTGKYLPYGYQRSGSGTQYATYTRDNTGLDYAMQRYYSSTIGRFTSPDPYMASGGPADPQSWNRYAYVGNDPVNFLDPKGLQRARACGGYLNWDSSDGFWIATGWTFWCYEGEFGGGGGHFTPPESGGGGGGGGFVQVKPKVPAGNNYNGAQMQALTNGLNDALSHTDQVDCATFYAGGDEDPSLATANVLENTMYRLLPLPQGPETGAQTADVYNVMINTGGAFFNAAPNANGTVSVAMPNAAGVQTTFTFADMSTFQGFMLLHELGHQMGVFGPDVDATANGTNSQAVLDHCLKTDAQGVWH